MSKKKTEKMKENRAGSYVPREFAEEIVATIESYEMEPEFAQGAACVLAYLSCPEGSGMLALPQNQPNAPLYPAGGAPGSRPGALPHFGRPRYLGPPPRARSTAG